MEGGAVSNPEYAAFPQVEVRNYEGMLVPYRQTGMTLRDYFAAKAMQGLLAGKLNTTNMMTIASECYMMADTMLKARQS